MAQAHVDGITLKSVAIRSTDTFPYTIVNGRNVSIDRPACPTASRICASISGSATENVSLISANAAMMKKKTLIGADVPSDQISY